MPSEPTRREYRSCDGKGPIPVMASVLTDPDGSVVEFDQQLADTLE